MTIRTIKKLPKTPRLLLCYICYVLTILTFLPVSTYALYTAELSAGDEGRAALFDVEILPVELTGGEGNIEGDTVYVSMSEQERAAKFVVSVVNKGETAVCLYVSRDIMYVDYKVYTDAELQNELAGDKLNIDRDEQLFVEISLLVTSDVAESFSLPLDFRAEQVD